MSSIGKARDKFSLAVPSEANRAIESSAAHGSQWQSLPLDAKCSLIFIIMLGIEVTECLSVYRCPVITGKAGLAVPFTSPISTNATGSP